MDFTVASMGRKMSNKEESEPPWAAEETPQSQPNFGESRGGARDTEDGDQPGREQPDANPGPAPGRTADLTEPPLPAGGTGGRRHRARYRGRRGGVNWARHRGTDRRMLIIGQLNI